MKNILLLTLCIVISCTLYAQFPYPSTVYFTGGNICESEEFKLVFHDEFDGSAIDLSKWTPYYPYGPNGSLISVHIVEHMAL